MSYSYITRQSEKLFETFLNTSPLPKSSSANYWTDKNKATKFPQTDLKENYFFVEPQGTKRKLVCKPLPKRDIRVTRCEKKLPFGKVHCFWKLLYCISKKLGRDYKGSAGRFANPWRRKLVPLLDFCCAIEFHYSVYKLPLCGRENYGEIAYDQPRGEKAGHPGSYKFPRGDSEAAKDQHISKSMRGRKGRRHKRADYTPHSTRVMKP